MAPLALVNVVDDRAGRDVRMVAAGLALAYPRVWALGGRVGNTVLAAGRRDLDLDRIRALAAADASPARLRPPGELARLAAGTVALRDDEL